MLTRHASHSSPLHISSVLAKLPASAPLTSLLTPSPSMTKRLPKLGSPPTLVSGHHVGPPTSPPSLPHPLTLAPPSPPPNNHFKTPSIVSLPTPLGTPSHGIVSVAWEQLPSPSLVPHSTAFVPGGVGTPNPQLWDTPATPLGGLSPPRSFYPGPPEQVQPPLNFAPPCLNTSGPNQFFPLPNATPAADEARRNLHHPAPRRTLPPHIPANLHLDQQSPHNQPRSKPTTHATAPSPQNAPLADHPLPKLPKGVAPIPSNHLPSGAQRHLYPWKFLSFHACPTCNLPVRMHFRGACLQIANRLRVPPMHIFPLLRAWLSTTAGWMLRPDRSFPPSDLQRLFITLHILHIDTLSLPDNQSSDTSPGPKPTQPTVDITIAAKGIGPTGCVPIPQHIWLSSAPGGLLLADARTPPQKPSNCPCVQAMLDALLSAGLVAIHPGLPNAEVFLKPKSSTKAALIINMRALNANCPFPPPKFRLPTLLEIGTLFLQHQTSASACISTIDLANCFWSIRLPPSNIGCIRVGTPRHTYTLLCLPFGWTHAPAIAQRVIAHHLAILPFPTPPHHAHSIQYLDDISFIGSSATVLRHFVQHASSCLEHAGFLLSPKSLLDPQPSAPFIGKLIDPANGSISSLPAYYAGIVFQWLSLATGPYTFRKASRLLGKLIWLSNPRRRILPFLAGPYAALRFGPRRCSRTSSNFTRACLEALSMTFASWHPPPPSLLPAASATRYYADAARTPWGLFSAGIWSPQMGCRFFFCPPWVLTQQTAELFAAFKALSLAAYRRDLSIHLFLDNHAAIFSLLRGKARSSLAPQNRLLRRVCYLLHWSGLIAALHYIPSSLNPADPPSRWWAYPSSFSLVRHTCMLGLSHLLDPPDLPWGTLAGLQRHF